MRGRRDRLFYALLALSLIAVVVTGVRTVRTPDYSRADHADRVVVVGVPSLDWEVITPESMPNLWALAERGGTGLTTARAARSVTCPWDGWTTLGAGNRARYPATIPEDELPPEPDLPLPGEPVPAEPAEPETPTPDEQRQEAAVDGCLGQRGTVPTVDGSKLTPAVTENDSLSFGAEPGALGSASRCTTVVGSAAILAVDRPEADVRVADQASTAEGWSNLVASCPLTLVATGHAFERTTAELQALDGVIGEIVAGAEAQGASVIVAGISQPEYVRARLHALVVAAPGLNGQVLSSPSTSRAPYSQLIDLAPTVLSMLGEKIPPSMTGQVLRGQDRESSLADQVGDYRDQSVAASAHIWMSGKFFGVLTWLTVLCTLALAIVLARRRGGGRWTRAAGTIVAVLPAASLIANLYPWWTSARPSAAIIVTLALSWAITSALCLFGPWRKHRNGPLLAACAITFGVLAADVLTGSHLQLDSPLGYDAIVAGRFTGFGNITFAMYAAAGLVLLAACCRLCDTKARVTVLVLTAGLAMIAMDGAPGAGADFGGVVALAPALVLLWLIVTGTRLSRGRAALVLVSGAMLVMGIAVLDYLRPEQDRTHLGRFVGQLGNGTALTIIKRKLAANWHVLTGSVLSVLAVVLLAVVLWQWLDRSSAGRRYVARYAPYAPAAVVAVLVMSLVGFAVNDSGIAVTAAALAVVLPPTLGLLRHDEPDPPADEPVAGATDHRRLIG